MRLCPAGHQPSVSWSREVIVIIIIIIILIYNSILCPTVEIYFLFYYGPTKQKGKRLHYIRCGSSLLNHGILSMLWKYKYIYKYKYEQQVSRP